MATTVLPVLMTADLRRLARFYARVFGAVEVDRTPLDGDPFFVRLRLGESELGVVADQRAASVFGSRMLLSIEVDDVDAMLDRVREAGGTTGQPPTDMAWGQRVAHVSDPDGNPVNLTTTRSR